jgi:hypothetical protein
MKSKSHLTPETITDVNGKITTVYRKNGAAAPVAKAAIPAPAPVPVHLPFDRVEYVTELLNYWGEHRTENFSEDEISDLFWRLDDSTLLAIDVDYQLDSGDGERMNAIYDWVGYFAQEQEEYLRELVTYAGAFADDQSVNFIEESIALLKGSGALPPMEDYSQADPELQQAIRGILSVTEAAFAEEYVKTDGADVFPELPDELRSLIMKRPDESDRIKEIVTMRETVDAELVRTMLDADAPAVSEGIL